MKKRLLAQMLLGFMACCPGAWAADAVSYQITVTHTNGQGVTAPLVGKEVSFMASFRRGTHLALSKTVKANTDKNGQATLTISANARPFLIYAGIDLFCAKLDGPHYCNGVFATTNSLLNPVDEPGSVKYDCSYSVAEAQPNTSGTISIDCNDR